MRWKPPPRTESKLPVIRPLLKKYFDVVIGTKGYSSKTKADAVDNAKQVLKDAVVAKEDAKADLRRNRHNYQGQSEL